MKEILELFPKYNNGIKITPIINADNEIKEFFEKRLISTYIPNEKKCKNLLEWQNYFIEEVYKRTGKKLSKNHKIINRLAICSQNFHENRNKINNISGKRCKCCNFDFSKNLSDNFVKFYDIMNPTTYPSNRESNVPNIDHIEPISKIGSNNSKNAQVLCWVCNSGKSDICAQMDKYSLFSERVKIELLDEFNNSQLLYNDKKIYNNKELEFMPKKLFYRVLNRDRKCRICGNEKKFFTMMPVYSEALYTYDNLITVCYDCMKLNDNIKDIRWVDFKRGK